MKVFIKEYGRDIAINIYDMENNECSEKFFEKFFCNVRGIHLTTEEEKEEYHIEGIWTIENACDYEYLALNINDIQKSIDISAKALKRHEAKEKLSLSGKFYAL